MISRYNCQLNSEKKRNDEKNQMTITGRQKKSNNDNGNQGQIRIDRRQQQIDERDRLEGNE